MQYEHLKCCEYLSHPFLIQRLQGPSGAPTSHLSCLYKFFAKGLFFLFFVIKFTAVLLALFLSVRGGKSEGTVTINPKVLK